MENVLQREHPGSSALALYLQTIEDQILDAMAIAAKGLHACVLSLVFDGMYVAMSSMSDIAITFDAVAVHVAGARSPHRSEGRQRRRDQKVRAAPETRPHG